MSTAARYLLAALFAILISASHLLDGPDESTTEALIQADKDEAIAAARQAAHARHASIGSQP